MRPLPPAYSREWYLLIQPYLIRFVNSKIGRGLLRTVVPAVDPDVAIISINSHVITYLIGADSGHLILTCNIFYTRAMDHMIYRFFWPLLKTLHAIDWLVLDRLPESCFNFGCYTANIPRDVRNSTDGWESGVGFKKNGPGTLATLRSYSTADLYDAGGGRQAGITVGGQGTSLDYLSRQTLNVMPYRLPLAEVGSATLYVVASGYLTNVFGPDIWVGYPARGVRLVTTTLNKSTGKTFDLTSFGKISTVLASDLNYDFFAGGVTYSSVGINFPLNASGLAQINLNGLYETVFGYVFEFDRANISLAPPGDSGAPYYAVSANCYSVADVSISGLPTGLAITYSLPHKVNIGGVWKDVIDLEVSAGGMWKQLDELNIDINDIWKKTV